MANLASLSISGASVISPLAGTALVDSNATGTGSPTITDVGEYRYHHYTGSGNFVMNSAGFVEMLIIGGGGGSCEDNAGGGGGGGFLFRALDLSAATYPVTFGSAGSGGTTTAQPGGNSVVGIISNGTAYGGGAGSSDGVTQLPNGVVGSCGASGKNKDQRINQNNQEHANGQGNCAGNSSYFIDTGAPGGGGSGSNGESPDAVSTHSVSVQGNAGNGGSGEFCSQFANFGVNGWFSGGGGGGAGQGVVGSGGYSGNGGGGDGGWDNLGNGEGGATYTGGGAGGGGQGTPANRSGGTGTVIFRYKRNP